MTNSIVEIQTQIEDTIFWCGRRLDLSQLRWCFRSDELSPGKQHFRGLSEADPTLYIDSELIKAYSRTAQGCSANGIDRRVELRKAADSFLCFIRRTIITI